MFNRKKHRLAVVVPTYPSEENMYLCAFVHSRVKAYQQAGINVEVLCVWDTYEDHSEYEIEGVHVTRLHTTSLEQYLFEEKFDVCFLHFFDLQFEAAVTSERLSNVKFFLWSHNPETRYWDWPLFTTPYFSAPSELTQAQKEEFEKRDIVIKKLNDQENVNWVFVSQTLKERSEELIGITFERGIVIPNLVDDRVYQFKKRRFKNRNSVIIVRKFDNVNTYALDVVMQVIVELSKRKGFRKLNFDIYGAGVMFDELTAPVKDFENVHLHEHFLSQNELKQAYEQHGIGLFATRFDSQGVAMCEAALSGMPVVSSQIDAANYFLPNDMGLLCEVENPVAYADVIEKLVKDRRYYKRCAKACHEKVRSMCSREQTVNKEIEINRKAVSEK
ncbi:MAG: glycosyltransferase family 4 protein [Phoenicibacter congonensis]|uniref:Glycosyltransferase family 4 protein n=1 Tax=Phoenicibacter congonensis TaxID=1944646 RepID=A0AA43RJ44_9ACTN|nr:glycosyltransferase family 4 protein [Phoenicibacter congonensis]